MRRPRGVLMNKAARFRNERAVRRWAGIRGARDHGDRGAALAVVAYVLCWGAGSGPAVLGILGSAIRLLSHYSTLDEINKANVGKLHQAWIWKTGEAPLTEYGVRPGMFENTPLMIDGIVYVRPV